MSSDAQVAYIKQLLAEGRSKDDIAASLAAQGVSAEDVADGFARQAAGAAHAATPTAAPMPTPAPVPPVAPVPPAAPVSHRRSRGSVVVAVAVCVIAAGGAALWYVRPATLVPVQESVAGAPVTAATTSEPVPPSTETFSFSPTLSGIPAFAISYDPSLGAPTPSETHQGLAISFGTSSAHALQLGVSYFKNPLSGSQTPSTYLKSIFPNASTTSTDTDGRHIVHVEDPEFPPGLSLYYIFLKNADVMTIQASNAGAYASLVTSLVRSITFISTSY